MIKVLFVCMGNICRSPMAEFVFKALVKEEGLSVRFILHLRQRAQRRSAIRCIGERVKS